MAIPAKQVAIPVTEGVCLLECIEPVAIPAELVAIPAKQVAIPAKLVAIPATEGNCLPRHGQGVVNIGQYACGHGQDVVNSSQEPSDYSVASSSQEPFLGVSSIANSSQEPSD